MQCLRETWDTSKRHFELTEKVYNGNKTDSNAKLLNRGLSCERKAESLVKCGNVLDPRGG